MDIFTGEVLASLRQEKLYITSSSCIFLCNKLGHQVCALRPELLAVACHESCEYNFCASSYNRAASEVVSVSSVSYSRLGLCQQSGPSD